MNTQRLQQTKALLKEPKNIVITNHVNPDGDAMGSALGLQLLLEKNGHRVNVVVPNQYPHFLFWLKGNDAVVNAEKQPEKASELINSADLIFHLDYNAYSRAGGLEEALRKASAKRILIDHHQMPETWPDVLYSDTTMSSTCQMIFEFAEAMGWANLIDRDTAYCLYTGLVTDTGSFRFSSTTPRTLEVAAHLMKCGVEPQHIYQQVFDTNSINRMRLLGEMLTSMKHFPEQKSALLFLPAEWQEKYGYQRGDSEGFVNYGLSIAGVEFSLFLREEKDAVKTSLRSKNNLDVNLLARQYFNGGGHKNAAGGKLKMNMEQALHLGEEVIKSLKWEEEN